MGVNDPIDEGTELHPARDAVPTIVGNGVVRLPEEPVGIGGTWEVVSHIPLESGIEIVETYRNTVTAIEPDGRFLIESSATADETVVPQEVDGSTLAPGAILVVDTIEMHGVGVGRLDLTSPSVAGVGASSMAFRMRLEAEGRSLEYATTADTELTTAPDGSLLPSAT